MASNPTASAIPRALTADELLLRMQKSRPGVETPGASSAPTSAPADADTKPAASLPQARLEREARLSRRQPLTAAEQRERFPILKHAPVDGAAGSAAIGVKPLGVALRNVKCSKCGRWGHQRGDRECPELHVISARDAERLHREDPMSYMPADEAWRRRQPRPNAADAAVDAAKDAAICTAHGLQPMERGSSITDTHGYVPEADPAFQAAQVAAAAARRSSKRRRSGSDRHRRRSKAPRRRHEDKEEAQVDTLLADLDPAARRRLLASILRAEGDEVGAAEAAAEAARLALR